LILIANIIESGTVAKTRMEVEQYGGQVSRKEDLWTPSAILDNISILFRFRLQILIELLSVQLCLLLPSIENKNRIILHQESVSQMGSCLLGLCFLGLAASPFAGYIDILADIKLSNKNNKKILSK